MVASRPGPTWLGCLCEAWRRPRDLAWGGCSCRMHYTHHPLLLPLLIPANENKGNRNQIPPATSRTGQLSLPLSRTAAGPQSRKVVQDRGRTECSGWGWGWAVVAGELRNCPPCPAAAVATTRGCKTCRTGWLDVNCVSAMHTKTSRFSPAGKPVNTLPHSSTVRSHGHNMVSLRLTVK